jgi:hypothetical protein
MFISKKEKKFLFESLKVSNDTIARFSQDIVSLKNKITNLQNDFKDRLEDQQSQINFYRKWVYDVEEKINVPRPVPKKKVQEVAYKRGRGRPLGSKNKK